MSAQTHGVSFSLLGPVTATRDGVPLDLGPRQRRVLLVRLLVARNRAVPLDRLCDDLWAGGPPARAATSVHAHISRLRRALDPAPMPGARCTVLLTTPYGYALPVADEDRDTVRFERAVAAGRALLDSGRPARAVEVLGGALDSWYGDVLEDAAGHPFAAREIARLQECRHTARELHIRAMLMAGRPERAVHTARDLVADEPLRESAWDLLMRCLWLLGRPAEAVQQYDRARWLLHRELGVEPGPALHGLCGAIKRREASLADCGSWRTTPVAC
ncbi:AfsR/SARP family transcriptional regulator [Streptomyces sp. NPDC094143]|uniref:AfsR/SARP family transcriptional regulator n=1 Tax=Streptomyces sp. NPDC094143 TaxID=3155310 RepID=UPI00331946D3